MKEFFKRPLWSVRAGLLPQPKRLAKDPRTDSSGFFMPKIMHKEVGFSALIGKTLSNVENKGDQVIFTCTDGDMFLQYHNQDCCENVQVEDIVGDLQDLIGSEILKAEESKSGENPLDISKKYQDSFTWTFYHLATRKGHVTIRWYGESNGYYSESVDFVQTQSKNIN